MELNSAVLYAVTIVVLPPCCSHARDRFVVPDAGTRSCRLPDDVSEQITRLLLSICVC